MNSDHCIELFIVHQDPLMTAGMAAVLGQDTRIRLRTSPAAGPLEEIAAGVADLVLADYQTGMACLSRIGAHPGRRQLSVIIVSALNRELDIRAALRAGVSGYLRQACRPEELLHAVLSVARGVRYLCPTITNGLADSVTLATLTERESKVLELIAAGLCNKTIARDLDISIGTVKSHVSAVLAKLQSRSRTQAVLRAAERGLIAPPGTQAPARESAQVIAFGRRQVAVFAPGKVFDYGSRLAYLRQ
ncbi:MAG TPA: response regulator transcription factor [Ideonella sp.]|nr:response regulator transcription factor [Ideonella sp.]